MTEAGHLHLHDNVLSVITSFLAPFRGGFPYRSKGFADDGAMRIELRAPAAVAPIRMENSMGQTTVMQAPNLSGTWIKDKKASESMEHVLRLMRMRGVMRQAVKLVKGMHIKQNDQTLTLEVFSYVGWFKMVEKFSMNGEIGTFRRRDLRRGHHTASLRVLQPEAPMRSLPLDYTPGNNKGTHRQMQQEQDSQGSNSNETQQMQKDNQQDFQDIDNRGVQQQKQGQGQQLGMPLARLAVDLAWGEPCQGTGLDVYELRNPDLLHLYSKLNVDGEEATCLSVFRRKQGS